MEFKEDHINQKFEKFFEQYRAPAFELNEKGKNIKDKLAMFERLDGPNFVTE